MNEPSPSSAKAAIDRRSSPRIHRAYRLEVFHGDRWIGYVADVSAGGLRLVCRAGVDLSNVDRVGIRLPHWLEMGESLELTCRSVWWRPCSGDERFEAGFLIEGTGRRTRARLQDLLERLTEAALEDGLI